MPIYEAFSDKNSPISTIRSKDAFNNEWSAFNKSQPPESVLYRDGLSRNVINEGGKSSLSSSIIEGFSSGELDYDYTHIITGGDARLVPIYDFNKSSRIPVAMERRAYSDESEVVLPTGWEMYALLDQLRLTFDTSGIKLIQPFAATDEAIYVPYIHGTNLFSLLDKLRYQPTARKVSKVLSQVLNSLHEKVNTVLTQFLTEMHMTAIERTDREDGTTQTIFSTKIQEMPYVGTVVEVNPVHDISNPHHLETLKNFMIYQDDAKKFEDTLSKLDPIEATEQLKESMICVDPIFLRGYKS